MHTTDPPPSAADRATHEHELATAPRNARVGMWLFAVYVVLYGGFMAMNAFFPQRMATAPFGGINLAVMYGLVLIVAAFVLALLYMFLVRRRPGGE
jgi:uncharacterized membrane protein (DUF485 family)